jgi:glutathionyl-hydroquinone reductase
MWDDYFAKDDAIRERYAAELEDLRADDAAYAYEQEYMQKVYEAGFGDDWQAYEAYFQQLNNDLQQFEEEYYND